MSDSNLTRLAEKFREVVQSGGTFKFPLMTMKQQAQFISLLGES